MKRIFTGIKKWFARPEYTVIADTPAVIGRIVTNAHPAVR